MARLISTQTIVTYGARIINYYMDETNTMKSEVNDIYVGDTVTNFSYIKDGKKVTISGKVSNIDLFFKSNTIDTKSNRNYILKDAVVNTITIDHSTKNNSSVDIVDAREVIEYNTEKECSKVAVLPLIKVYEKSILSDGNSSEATFNVGDYLFNVTILSKGTEITKDCSIVSFDYSVNETGKATIVGLILKSDNVIFIVPFDAIKVCGKKGIVVETQTDVRDALDKAMSDPTVGGVVLKSLEYPFDVQASSVKVNGNKSGVTASSGDRCTDTPIDGETVFTGNLSILDGADVTFNGLTFTKASTINVAGASAVKFKNCRFIEAMPSATKTYFILAAETENPVLYQFEDCYFGTNPTTTTGKMYNLFEINSHVANGSYIKNCYFAKACCTHNVINIYDVEEGAVINIEDNIFEYSANAIRVGIKGDKTATINCNRNTYYETDSDVDYAGLMLVQPYGKVTTSFKNVTINLNKTVNKTNLSQLIYLYCGGSDTQITKDTEPKVYINGLLTSLIK